MHDKRRAMIVVIARNAPIPKDVPRIRVQEGADYARGEDEFRRKEMVGTKRLELLTSTVSIPCPM